ncbi:TPA: glycosyltransferase [Pseudomonas aeruginosa]|nr:glycosyltransferase [Pseudomonas aeruginosa]
MTRSAEPRVLQFCHGYDGPFLDCARQYASLFAGTPYKVTTVFLTGRSDPEVAARCASDEVLFLEYGSRDIRGLKLKAIRDLREIARSRDFRFCIAHRFKPIWIASLATRLPIVGVHHAFGDYQRLSRKVFAGLMSKRLSLLAILGSGRLEEQLKDLACELGIGERVLFLGQVEEARRYFKAFDAFALSSDHEPFGMVLLEAMVAGVPLIATACGGAREVVEGVGILFPLGDETALAEGLTHLAALDRRQREACARLMLERLETRFSDAAVRREFWRLPTIAGFASESAC